MYSYSLVSQIWQIYTSEVKMKEIYIFKHYPPPSPSPIPLALERLPCTLITTPSLEKLLDPPLVSPFPQELFCWVLWFYPLFRCQHFQFLIWYGMVDGKPPCGRATFLIMYWWLINNKWINYWFIYPFVHKFLHRNRGHSGISFFPKPTE